MKLWLCPSPLQALANSGWALAVMEVQPSPQWRVAFLAASQVGLAFQDVMPDALMVQLLYK